MSNKIIIVGYFQEVVELCAMSNMEIVGVIDNNIKDKVFNGVPILGKDEDAEKIFRLYPNIPIVISPDIPAIRKNIFTVYKKIGFGFASIISPKSTISPSAIIGEGVFIQSGVNISSNVKIGNFIRINVNANVMHDCDVEDFTTIAPNAVLLGKVRIGELTYIGSNSTILPNLFIGKKATIGAGALITKNVDDNNVMVGNPGRVLRINL